MWLAEGWLLLKGVWSTEVVVLCRSVTKGDGPGDEETTASLAQRGCCCKCVVIQCVEGDGTRDSHVEKDVTPRKACLSTVFGLARGSVGVARGSVGVTETTCVWLVMSLLHWSCEPLGVCSHAASSLMPFMALRCMSPPGHTCSSLLVPSQGLWFV